MKQEGAKEVNYDQAEPGGFSCWWSVSLWVNYDQAEPGGFLCWWSASCIKQNLEGSPADDQPAAEGIAYDATLHAGCFIAKVDPFLMELVE